MPTDEFNVRWLQQLNFFLSLTSSLLLFFEADLVVPPQAKAHRRFLTAGLKKNKCQSDGLEAASLVISRK